MKQCKCASHCGQISNSWDKLVYSVIIIVIINNNLIIVVSDMTDMDGGELEIIKMEKYAGMKALTEGNLKPEVGQ